MKAPLLNLFERLGIKSAAELTPEEKVIFDNYDAILSKEYMTIDDVKQFCETQISVITAKWMDYGTENTKKAELIPYHTVYKVLLQTLSSPEAERKALEDYLVSQINN